jgi:hypothetical protein
VWYRSRRRVPADDLLAAKRRSRRRRFER